MARELGDLEADKMPKDIDGVNMLRRLAFDVGFEEGVKTHRSTYCALLRKAAGEEFCNGNMGVANYLKGLAKNIIS